MILQSLLAYYQAQASKGVMPRYGWAKQKVSYALEIDEHGRLLALFTLLHEEQKGKKTIMVPRSMEVPMPFVRSSGICSNFLCDNAKYLLGVDVKDELHGARCFENARERHEEILSNTDSPAAKSVLAFFRTFDSMQAKAHSALAQAPDDLWTANLVFLFKGEYVHNDPGVIEAWNLFYSAVPGEDSEEGTAQMRCLLTGEKTVPQATHAKIHGIPGAQSSGASLVSFNAPAFESFGRNGEQNLNAPIGKFGAFAYTTALNYLIADKKHNRSFGDTLLLYWAEDAELAYQDLFSMLFDPDSRTITDADLDAVMKKITSGQTFEWENVPVNPSNHFYLLGISPNAARLSVRFFYQDSFGAMIRNLKEHYDRLAMIPDGQKQSMMLPLWRILNETVNPKAKDKKASPQLSGDMLRAILTGGRYPTTLFDQLQLRIRADHEINHVRAAAIKAYLLKNMCNETNKETLNMELNENTTYQPYVLGRLFAVLERIQERASSATTIKDKYFTSAASTPSVVFPLIVDLSEKHLRKMSSGEKVYFEKLRQSLLCMVESAYPAHYSLADQGIFQLGYYHQKQKFFEKKATANADNIS